MNIRELRRKVTDPYHLLPTTDGINLFLRIWEPPLGEKGDAAILLLHGITAHSAPYSIFAEPVSKLGFTVYGLDLRGHGLSDGNRGDYPSKERYEKDLCETLSYLKTQHSQVILLGHSLGVFSSITAMNNCLENIDGAILLSAGRTIHADLFSQISTLNKLKIIFSSIFFPSKPVIEYRREGMVGLDDPLFNFEYTLRFMRMLDFEGIAFPESLDFPILVSIGENDELFSVASARELYESIPTTKKEFMVISKAQHAVFPKDSWIELANWIKENL